jgi:hypothetical protein
MTLLWCWRCKIDVPMVDDGEFKQVMSVRGMGTEKLARMRVGPILMECEGTGSNSMR